MGLCGSMNVVTNDAGTGESDLENILKNQTKLVKKQFEHCLRMLVESASFSNAEETFSTLEDLLQQVQEEMDDVSALQQLNAVHSFIPENLSANTEIYHQHVLSCRKQLLECLELEVLINPGKNIQVVPKSNPIMEEKIMRSKIKHMLDNSETIARNRRWQFERMLLRKMNLLSGKSVSKAATNSAEDTRASDEKHNDAQSSNDTILLSDYDARKLNKFQKKLITIRQENPITFELLKMLNLQRRRIKHANKAEKTKMDSFDEY